MKTLRAPAGRAWLACWAALACAMLLSACQPSASPAAAPTHEVYVWQRAWRPALGTALLQAADLSQRWRVLAGQASADGQLQPVAIDTAMLQATARPVMMVLRIEGQFGTLDDPAAVSRLITQITALRQRWQAWGLQPAGIEIDHDCGTARLAGYARFLSQLRGSLVPEKSGQQLSLSITALPAWLASPQLESLLAQVDESVLQVHAVKQPREGLFDASQAQRWAADYGRRTPKPFRVALPAYGTRVSFDDYGNLAAVDSETPGQARHDDARELSVSPRAVAGLIKALQADPPSHWSGWAWFRLPTADDRRAWSLATWRAVAQGQPLAAPASIQQHPGADPGLVEVLLHNASALDADLPQNWVLPRECSVADAANGYQLRRAAGSLQFQRPQPGLLRPHSQLLIGWMRCTPPPSTPHATS